MGHTEHNERIERDLDLLLQSARVSPVLRDAVVRVEAALRDAKTRLAQADKLADALRPLWIAAEFEVASKLHPLPDSDTVEIWASQEPGTDFGCSAPAAERRILLARAVLEARAALDEWNEAGDIA